MRQYALKVDGTLVPYIGLWPTEPLTWEMAAEYYDTNNNTLQSQGFSVVPVEVREIEG